MLESCPKKLQTWKGEVRSISIELVHCNGMIIICRITTGGFNKYSNDRLFGKLEGDHKERGLLSVPGSRATKLGAPIYEGPL
jgi:hypothetical protein